MRKVTSALQVKVKPDKQKDILGMELGGLLYLIEGEIACLASCIISPYISEIT